MLYKYNSVEAKKLLETTSLPSWTEFEKFLKNEQEAVFTLLTNTENDASVHRLQGKAQLLAELLNFKDAIRQVVPKLEAQDTRAKSPTKYNV